MEPIELVLLVAGAAAVAAAGVVIASSVQKQKRESDLLKTLSAALPGAVVTRHDGWTAAETETAYYLIKSIPMNPNHELIITNRFFWCVNADLKNWRRASVPDLVPGVRPFLAHAPQTEKPVVRIALIAPRCVNITRYLNEADVEVVRPDRAADGVHFVMATDLARFMTDRAKK